MAKPITSSRARLCLKKLLVQLNNTPLGYLLLVDLELICAFNWLLTVKHILQPTIGTDFLKHFEALFDLWKTDSPTAKLRPFASPYSPHKKTE